MYGVYAAEMAQAILMAKMAYTEFAAGFGNFEAINDVGLLWLAVPVMSSVGMYHPLLGRSLAYKWIT